MMSRDGAALHMIGFGNTNRRTVPASAARILIQALEQIHGDTATALTKSRLQDEWPLILDGLQHDILRSSFAALAKECVLAFHLHACRRDSLPPLPLNNFRLMCTALLACPTLRTAIDVSSDFQDIALGGVNKLERSIIGDQFTLSLNTQVRGQQVGDMLVAMFGLAAFHRLLGWLARAAIPLMRVQLRFPPMPEQSAFNELLHLEPEFDRPSNSISFPSRYLDLPIVRKYHEIEQLFALFPFDLHPPEYDHPTLAERSRAAIAAALDRGESPPTMARLADMFGMSISSFRRRMRDEDASLLAIRNLCRKNLAIDLVERSSQTMKEIAYRACFSDVSTFRRAFKLWTGTSPQQHRIAFMKSRHAPTY